MGFLEEIDSFHAFTRDRVEEVTAMGMVRPELMTY
jgi:hypothetical protein